MGGYLASAAANEFFSGFMFELMYISLIISIRSNLFVCSNRINLLNLKQNSDRQLVLAKEFLKLSNVCILIK